ncbi:MAG: hypothetical protein RR986_06595 [Longicatena sp.]
MFRIHVKQQRQKLYWSVNKKGFISVYGMLLLSIFLAFTILLTTIVETFSTVLKKEYTQLAYIDLHIIKTIKAKIKEETTMPKETTDDTSSTSETMESFYHVLITYQYIDEKVYITYQNHQIEARIDLQKKILMDYTYVS